LSSICFIYLHRYCIKGATSFSSPKGKLKNGHIFTKKGRWVVTRLLGTANIRKDLVSKTTPHVVHMPTRRDEEKRREMGNKSLVPSWGCELSKKQGNDARLFPNNGQLSLHFAAAG
jgi:hypothetical protein